MVSRRNYAAITAVMAIIFFLFQFLNMAKETEKHYNNEINEAAREFDKIKDELLKELNETEKQTQKKGEGKKKLEEYQEKIKCLREKIEYGSNN